MASFRDPSCLVQMPSLTYKASCPNLVLSPAVQPYLQVQLSNPAAQRYVSNLSSAPSLFAHNSRGYIFQWGTQVICNKIYSM